MRSGIVASVKVSDWRSRSSSFVIIIGKHLQGPGTGEKKRDFGKIAFELLACSADALDAVTRDKQHAFERATIPMNPPTIAQAGGCLSKPRVNVRSACGLMECAQIVGARSEGLPLRTGPRGSDGDFERHLHVVSMECQQPPPPLELRRAFGHCLSAAANSKPVPDGDERGAFEEARAHLGHSQHKIAIAERLIVRYHGAAEEQLTQR